jgi:glyoxylase-like metal-dependent hydrolase (beta-lactamase superfamily II)
MIRRLLLLAFALTWSATVPAARAPAAKPAEPPPAPTLELLELTPHFFMLVGAGANIGVQVGVNGMVLVNAGTAPLSPEVLTALKPLMVRDRPIRFIIDTSADADVVGGNAALAAAGRSVASSAGDVQRKVARPASILSRSEVLERLSAPPAKGVAVNSAGWPTEAFGEQRHAFYFNDEGIEILHLPAAHTDGDAVVFFRKSDVVVAGNLIDADHFPMIDVARGGSLQGEIDALTRIIELAIPPGPYYSGLHVEDEQPGGTFVIPGRGHVLRQVDVANYRDMLVIVADEVQGLIDQNKSLDEIKAADPAKPFKSRYGATSGPWTTDMFIEAVYKSLVAGKKPAEKTS